MEEPAEGESVEEEESYDALHAEEILPELTGMPIEVHIRRHRRFILFLAFCLYLGWYSFALFLITWVTGVRWADN